MSDIIDEGYIKFRLEWDKGDPVSKEDYYELGKVRSKLFDLGLIGEYDNGIGFGNISQKVKGGTLITGTQTGGTRRLIGQHYTWVTSYSIGENWVRCKGPIGASSETLSHIALYEMNPRIGAIIHVHNKPIWKKYLGVLPTTDKSVAYGTPDMAKELQYMASQCEKLSRTGFSDVSGILIMAGHEEGIIAFGEDLSSTEQLIDTIL